MRFHGLLTLLCLAGCAAASGLPDPPFQVTVEDVSARFPGAPRLHSFASAEWEGKWVFIGGRTGGFHGVGGKEADFPASSANQSVWVVDTTTEMAQTFRAPLSELPAALSAVRWQWSAANLEFAQAGRRLFVAGGYGADASGRMVTHATLSAVDLPALIDAVMGRKGLGGVPISFVETPLAQVAGGEMLRMGDAFYLIGGHVFTGDYTHFEAAEERNSAEASQRYTGEIRKLRIDWDGRGKPVVTLAAKYEDAEFARRDFNAAVLVAPDGKTLQGAAFGGVFTKQQTGFQRPVYWTEGATPAPQAGFEQKLNGYTCAHFELFDPATKTAFVTFLGGISEWTWSHSSATVRPAHRKGGDTDRFEGMDWVDHVMTLVKSPVATFETVQAARLPGYLGSNAVFFPAPGLERIYPEANVFNLAAMRGRTLVGYLVGGLQASPKEFPYGDSAPNYRAGNIPTRVNDRVLAVYVTPPVR